MAKSKKTTKAASAKKTKTASSAGANAGPGKNCDSCGKMLYVTYGAFEQHVLDCRKKTKEEECVRAREAQIVPNPTRAN